MKHVARGGQLLVSLIERNLSSFDLKWLINLTSLNLALT